MKNNPLVSVIIPVYNRAHLIGETLESVIEQTYSNWECLVVDDGSSDDTKRVVQKFTKLDQRIKFLERPKNKKKGANACRNFGFENSFGEYINWIDSDDKLDKNFIKHKIEAFNSSLDAVISKTVIVLPDRTKRFEERYFITANTLEDFINIKVTWFTFDPLWSRSFLKGKALFDEDLLKGQDRDFHIRMLLLHPKLKIVDEYLYYYNMNSNSISEDYSKEVSWSMFHAARNRNKLLLNYGISKGTQFYLLKLQTKLYTQLHNMKGIHREYFKEFCVFYQFNFKYLKLVLQFLLAIITFAFFGKGEKILK